MFLCQIHGYLTNLHDFAFTALCMNNRFVKIVMCAYLRYDVINSYRLVFRIFSISFIISTAANTNKITISVSPYTYNLLGTADFELAASKNIVIEMLTANYVEDQRLSNIAKKADKTYVDEIASKIPTDAHINELINAALLSRKGD